MAQHRCCIEYLNVWEVCILVSKEWGNQSLKGIIISYSLHGNDIISKMVMQVELRMTELDDTDILKYSPEF